MAKRSKKSSKQSRSVSLKKVDWLGLNHAAVAKHFEGSPEFVNYMNVGKDGDLVAAVYHSKNPNREKGHKEFMLLWKYYDHAADRDKLMVSGMELAQLKKHAKVSGVACLKCNTAMWSLDRHHYHGCGCSNEAIVDGGKDYLKYGAKDMSNVALVSINLMTDKVSVDTKVKSR